MYGLLVRTAFVTLSGITPGISRRLLMKLVHPARRNPHTPFYYVSNQTNCTLIVRREQLGEAGFCSRIPSESALVYESLLLNSDMVLMAQI